MKYLLNRWTDLCQIHTEGVFGPSFEEFEGQGQGYRGKKQHFRPFGTACMQFMFGETSLASSF